ncbi:MAG: VWA domain-containing protein, partial [Clostridia bacterium]
MKNRVFGVLLAMCVLLMTASVPLSARTADAEGEPSVQWTVSKSKTAEEMKNFKSDVTISLPSAEEKPSLDVVLVIDISGSMKAADIAEAKKAAVAVCDELAAQSHVETHIGIVTFDKTAHDLTGGLVTVTEAKDAVEKIVSSADTNMMAGLIAGKAMLDSGSASDKYMVIMSDGIPIYWMENGEPMSKTAHHFRTVDENGFPVSETSFPAGADPEASVNDLSAVMPIEDLLVITDWNTDADDWYANSNTGETFDNGYKYTNIQKSTYYTAKYLQDEIFGRYKVKMVAFGTDKYKNNAVYQYGENFCDWIGEQPGVSYYKVAKPNYGGEEGDLVAAFDEIADEMICLIDAGSKVLDFIGAGKDNGGNNYSEKV